MLYFLQYQSSDNTLTVNNTLTVIGTILLYIVIVVVVFLIIRELVMWYWKINERITIQNETNTLIKKLIETIENRSELIDQNKIDQGKNIKANKLNDLFKLFNNFDVNDVKEILWNFPNRTRNEILIALKVLKNKSSLPPDENLEKIYKHLNLNSVDELWNEVNLLLDENN